MLELERSSKIMQSRLVLSKLVYACLHIPLSGHCFSQEDFQGWRLHRWLLYQKAFKLTIYYHQLASFKCYRNRHHKHSKLKFSFFSLLLPLTVALLRVLFLDQVLLGILLDTPAPWACVEMGVIASLASHPDITFASYCGIYSKHLLPFLFIEARSALIMQMNFFGGKSPG